MSIPADRNFDRTIELAASPDDVWKALSEGEEISRWFAMEATVKPGAEGSVFLSWGPEFEAESPIEIWEPGKHLRTYDTREVDGKPVKIAVDYHIKAVGGKTRLRIVHSGFTEDESWDDEFDAITSGWKIFMQNLKIYLERFPGKPAFNVWKPLKTPESLGPDAAWDALIGPQQLVRVEGDGGVGRAFQLEVGGDLCEGVVDIWHPGHVFGGVFESPEATAFRLTFGNLFRAVELTLLNWGGDRSHFDQLLESSANAIRGAIGTTDYE